MTRDRSFLARLWATAAAVALCAGVAQAAEWPRIPVDASEGATVWDPAPQWPSIPDETAPATRAKATAAKQAAAVAAPLTRPVVAKPSVAAATPIAAPAIEPASPTQPTEATRAADTTQAAQAPPLPTAAGARDRETTGAFLDPPPARPLPVAAPSVVVVGPPPFAFEVGARYWYSDGYARFGFANGDPLFGNPTSTLDWKDVVGNTGELFARVDHRPTGLFAKGLIGGGSLSGGTIVDRDFLYNQINFSDTSSAIKGDNIQYGLIDVGWAFEVPSIGFRLGAFAGYHYWREKQTAYGLTCNADGVGGVFCGPPGTVLYTNATAVLAYEPTWQALRLGVDGRWQFLPQWSVTGEFAVMPVAWLENKDSHLLRQSFADLGPAPNIVSRSTKGWGVAGDVFVNYAVTGWMEIGVGARVWSLATEQGTVAFGPTFSTDFDLTRFEQVRYGLLAHVKGRF